jgi:hypothetical protein
VVFVSHDLGLVKQVCDRAIYIQDGTIQAEGEPSMVINRYVGAVLEKQRAWAAEAPPESTNGLTPSHRHGDRIGEVMDVEFYGANGEPARAVASGERVTVRVRTQFHGEQPEPMVGILIRTRTGLEVFGTNTKVEETPLPACGPGDVVEVEFSFECRLTPQEYTLTVATQHPSGHSHDWLDDAIAFRVLDVKARAGVANLETAVKVAKQGSGSGK